MVALHTGMRFSEQIGLKWDDLDFKQRILTVRDSKPGKSRHVPLNEIAFETLKEIPPHDRLSVRVLYGERNATPPDGPAVGGMVEGSSNRKLSLARLAAHLCKPSGNARN